jgi:hypothetical protein
MTYLLTQLRGKHQTQRGDEAGMAMIMVVIMISIMLMVPIGLATATVGQLPLARHDENYTSALLAAESGVNDYINRLNAYANTNTSYWSSSVANTTNKTPPDPADGNRALLGWVNVSSADPKSLVEGYCYTVDMTGTEATGFSASPAISSQQGIIQLTSYGYASAGGDLPATSSGANPCAGAIPSGGVERIVYEDLRQVGFLNYLELTDLQLVDQDWFNQEFGTNITDCYNDSATGNYAYYWKHTANDCGDLQNYWVTGNVLYGPIRTNDDYYLCGTPEFLPTTNVASNQPVGQIISDDPTSTVGVNGGVDWADPYNQCGGDNPDFENVDYNSGGRITAEPNLITFPTLDNSVETWGKSTTPGNVGCYYVGPTDIQLSGSTMTVVSPLTNASDSPTTANPCVGTDVPIPSGGVIYVDSGSQDCSASFGTNLNWALTGLPSGDVCNSDTSPGDVFIQGVTKGGLTVVSADNIFITGDLTYADGLGASSQDVLGLIADNYIQVVHPTSGGSNVYGTEPFYGSTRVDAPADWGTSSCNNNTANPDCNVTVDAAYLSLSHSLGVQNWGQGAPFGTLNIDGALAQEYMDIEGVFSGGCNYTTQGVQTQLCNGMNSVYTYDTRLLHLSPPHFLNPEYALWQAIDFQECPTAGCQSYPTVVPGS